MSNLGGIFVVLSAGTVIALIVGVCEFLWHRRMDVLVDGKVCIVSPDTAWRDTEIYYSIT